MSEQVSMRRFHIGVDLGQRKDHTALVVIEERLLATRARDAVTFEPVLERLRVVRHVERIALGTEFRRVIEKLRWMTHHKALEGGDVTVCADATGLGAPVVETLRYAGCGGS